MRDMHALVATRSFIGIDADLWTAVAAFVGPLVAVLIGLWVFKIQQQSQHASQRFLTDGVQKLSGTLSSLLSIHLLNYQIGTYIIRTLRTYERGAPLAPDPNELPRFLGLELDSLPIDAVLPVQELVGDKVVLDWVMHVLSDVTLEAKEGDFQIRRPIVAYYTDPSLKVNVDEAVRQLTALLDGWEALISPHFALLDRLYDLERHLVSKRPLTAKGFFAVSKRSQIEEIRGHLQRGYDHSRKVEEETEALRKGGGAAP
jgi:hypothetical protein